MKKTSLWRGLLAITLSLTVALSSLTGVAETWRSTIDSLLGTASTVTTEDDKFTSVYETTDDLVAAHVDLGERVSEEGTVLLKNENAALPLKSATPKVTLFGMGAVYPFMGGTMGSTISGATFIGMRVESFGYIYGSNLELGNEAAFTAGNQAIWGIILFVVTWLVAVIAAFLPNKKKA